MENKKDIGIAFKEKLNSLDRVPGDHVWNSISDAIEKDRKGIKGKNGLSYLFVAILILLGISTMVILDQSNIIVGKNINVQKLPNENGTVENGKVKTITNSVDEVVNSKSKTNETNANENDSLQNEKVTTSKFSSKSKNNIENIKASTQANLTGTITESTFFNTSPKSSNNNFGSTLKPLNSNLNKIDLLDNEKGKTSKIKSNTTNAFGTVNASKHAKLASGTTASELSSSSQKKIRKKFVSLSGKNNINSLTESKKGKARRNAVKKSSVKVEIEEINQSLAKNDEAKVGERLTDFSPLQTGNAVKMGKELKTEKLDSIAKKDKTITVLMHPEDNIENDSLKAYQKFYVDIFASPTLYGYFSTGNVFDNRLNSLDKKSAIKLGYGLGITYDFSEKTSFRFGVSIINVSHRKLNAPVNVSDYSCIYYNGFVSNQTILQASNAMPTKVGGPVKMDITYQISYIEIPCMIKYKFFDQKIGIRSSLGFSYLLLNESKVSIETNSGYRQYVGKIKALNQNSFSINIGLDADYPVFTHTKVFVEPILNYQLRTFAETPSQPYIFGLHFGLRHSFNN
jgi:hypothetical protein